MIAPVLNVLCHWDCGQFKQREPELEMQLSRCLSVLEAADGERFAGLSMGGRQGAGTGSSSRETGGEDRSRAGAGQEQEQERGRAGEGQERGRSRTGEGQGGSAASAGGSPNGSGHQWTARRHGELRTHELLSAS